MDNTLYMYMYERYLASYLGMVSPRWVLQISSDRDDRMGQKLKTRKIPRASNDTIQKSLDQKYLMLNFQALKFSRKHKII